MLLFLLHDEPNLLCCFQKEGCHLAPYIGFGMSLHHIITSMFLGRNDIYILVVCLKVDVEESLVIAKAESIRSVPTFKIYKNGEKVKEMVRPSHQFLEDSVRTSF